jgi:NhaP-type Na+/H+ or K+/H+ antiporter
MLLAIGLGMLAAVLVFLNLPILKAGILGVVLTPTDAGLGEIIITSPRVPFRVRESLLVEAGLNDGLAVPFLLFFMAFAAGKIEGCPLALMELSSDSCAAVRSQDS